jgi:hypothetical protein
MNMLIFLLFSPVKENAYFPSQKAQSRIFVFAGMLNPSHRRSWLLETQSHGGAGKPFHP